MTATAFARPLGGLLLMIAVILAGCHGPAVRRSPIPRELLAKPVTDPVSVDISRLAGTGVESEAIGPGDLLSIRASTGIETAEVPAWHVRVGDDGVAPIPLIGGVRVAGLSTVLAQDAIRQASMERGIYRNPSVSVAINQRKVHRVFVGGAVKTPGRYELPAAHCDLRSALLAAGGLDDSAGTLVEIHRPGPGGATVAVDAVDLIAATSQGAATGRLPDGTVLTVVKRPARTVHVLGLVQRPTSVEIPAGHDLRLLDAIAAAGGTKLSLADKTYLVRKTGDGTESKLFELSISEAKQNAMANPVLAHGDTISVEETPTTFAVGLVEKMLNIGVGFTPSVGF